MKVERNCFSCRYFNMEMVQECRPCLDEVTGEATVENYKSRKFPAWQPIPVKEKALIKIIEWRIEKFNQHMKAKGIAKELIK